MKAGAFDYLTKPFDLTRLLEVVARAARAVEPEAEPPEEPAEDEVAELLGGSEVMVPVWKLIAQAAQAVAPVLITGETGTGKELVARAIHRHSDRAKGPFVAVNIAALAPTLLESELFGHERGAFTGAAALRRGRIELAEGGTLFLDEIGDLERSLQTKLLRFLQERQFERVGGQATLSSDARIIAATHRPVRPETQSTLREDLYFRLAVVEISLPPLRERGADIVALARRFAAHMGLAGVTPQAERLLASYSWPGNVRQLKHLVERAAVLGPGRPLGSARLEPAQLDAHRRAPLEIAIARGRRRIRAFLARASARGSRRQPRQRRPSTRHPPKSALRQAPAARVDAQQGIGVRASARVDVGPGFDSCKSQPLIGRATAAGGDARGRRSRESASWPWTDTRPHRGARGLDGGGLELSR